MEHTESCTAQMPAANTGTETANKLAIYALIDPRTNAAYYIGLSYQPRARLIAHCSDPASSAWPRSRDIIDSGLKPRLEILLLVTDKFAGRRLERLFIIALDKQLDNREQRRPYLFHAYLDKNGNIAYR